MVYTYYLEKIDNVEALDTTMEKFCSQSDGMLCQKTNSCVFSSDFALLAERNIKMNAVTFAWEILSGKLVWNN